ncbi:MULTISPECIES: hypothetical protein [Clostridium]|nr:hypothetical protein [[Clostridium] innocuum]MCQ5278903.1 hypothetical protein [Clostridium sp. DFI.1.208]MCC2845713.1 hypothetical protein [[Clostridium] innocuum]MCC2849936.1 hypothetical protein [[Clostridium] innocuum]MCC2853981.1 hypothetical protein [[Clostridium] innocuum]MCG4661531.1 hypothetical protein [[Clostridium] innocuum]
MKFFIACLVNIKTSLHDAMTAYPKYGNAYDKKAGQYGCCSLCEAD